MSTTPRALHHDRPTRPVRALPGLLGAAGVTRG